MGGAEGRRPVAECQIAGGGLTRPTIFSMLDPSCVAHMHALNIYFTYLLTIVHACMHAYSSSPCHRNRINRNHLEILVCG